MYWVATQLELGQFLALHNGGGQNQDTDPDYPPMNLQQIHAVLKI